MSCDVRFKVLSTATEENQADSVTVEPALERVGAKRTCVAEVESQYQSDSVTVEPGLEWMKVKMSWVTEVESDQSTRQILEYLMAAAP